MSVIEVEDLRKRYGDREVVRGIDLTVEAGQVVAVLGPNGAGKTTTVEILEGLTERSGGQVRVLGVDPARADSAWRERVGVVLQHVAVEPYLTVRELLDLHRGFYRHPRPTDELLALVGLTEEAGAQVRTLSGGQVRRVDVALALVGAPELVFLDEPTTGFDPAARHQAWDAIRALKDLGTTIVLTTHYLEEAETLADRIVVLADGRIVADGPPGSLGDRHRAASRVSFHALEGVAPDELPVPVEVEGRRWTARCADPTVSLHALTAWAIERDLRLSGLTIAPPSLEEIYLEAVR